MPQRSVRTTATPWTASAAKDELPSWADSAPTMQAGEVGLFPVANSEPSGETLQPR